MSRLERTAQWERNASRDRCTNVQLAALAAIGTAAMICAALATPAAQAPHAPRWHAVIEHVDGSNEAIGAHNTLASCQFALAPYDGDARYPVTYCEAVQ